MNDPKKSISSFSDSEFLSLLYAERDRESNLNQVPGWSLWAILGATVTVLCAGYGILKSNILLSWIDVVYYCSALIATFLFLASIFNGAPREKGYDPSKVRYLKEVIPYDIIFVVFLSGFASVVLIPVWDDCNLVFWGWAALIMVDIISSIICIFHRNDIVGAYKYDVMFSGGNANRIHVFVSCGLYGLIIFSSIREEWRCFINPEFEFSVCLSVLIVLLYFLVKIKKQNSMVGVIDEAIDGFLYRKETKEETFRMIVKTRMGYGVIDACVEELARVKVLLKQSQADEDELDKIMASVNQGDFPMEQLGPSQERISVILVHEHDLVDASRKLVAKMTIIANVSSLPDLEEFHTLLKDTNAVSQQVDSVTDKIDKMIDYYKARLGITDNN